MNRYAAIDIGTNTILLLIADIRNDGTLQVICDEHSIARLGKDVDKTQMISSDGMKRAFDILSHYTSLIDKYNVDYMRIVSTSAMRDAKNRDEVLKELSSITPTIVECISGLEEARLTYNGSIDIQSTATIVDIGGGSTEITFGEHGTIKKSFSLDIGAVRLTERFLFNYPSSPEQITLAKNNIAEMLKEIQFDYSSNFIAVAGTPTTLACIDMQLSEFNRDIVQGYILNVDSIRAITSTLLKSTYDELVNTIGIHPKRADILPAGSLILQEIMTHFSENNCIVSTRGLRYGVVLDMASSINKSRYRLSL